MVVSGVVTSTTHVLIAGVASTFPALSIARTRTLWLPSVSPLNASGEVQLAKAAASTLHSKVPASVEEKVMLAVVALVIDGGAEVRVVSGAAVSTVQVKVAGVASRFPAV